MVKKQKEHGEFLWSWFYRYFIKHTVNDNFYTSEEIMKNQKKIINDVKKIPLPHNKKHKQC